MKNNTCVQRRRPRTKQYLASDAVFWGVNGDIVGKIATTATSAGRRASWEIAKPPQVQKDAERQKWEVTDCEQRQRVGDLALASCASARNNSDDESSEAKWGETGSEADEEMHDELDDVAALAA